MTMLKTIAAAMGWINLNRREEALIHIERYLGRYWIGRLAS